MEQIKLDRRTVLKAAAVLGAFLAAPKAPALAAPPPYANLPYDPRNTEKTIIVVGAGVAGISAAYVAAKAGFRVVVLESNDRFGGRSLTVRPTDSHYRDWWFSKYNPSYLFPEMYVDRYRERPDSPVQQDEVGDFVVERWPNSSEYVELFLNAGPGRIPSNHSIFLDLCGEIGVRLEPYIFLSGSNLLSSKDYMDGKPVQWREINFSLMGDMAQILARAVKDGMVFQGFDRDQILNMLKQFGDLSGPIDGDLPFDGSATVGYLRQPGGWQTDWAVNEPINLDDILGSGFVGSGDAEQSAGSFLFNPNHILWQPTLMQPVGGMDRLWQGLLLQEIPGSALSYDAASGIKAPDTSYRDAEASLRGKSFVGDLVHLNSKITALENTDTGVRITLDDGQVLNGDYCIATVAPALLGGADTVPTSGKNTPDLQVTIPPDMKISSNLSDDFKSALADVQMTPAIKVGFQGKYRFWEEEDQIYGGISWTTDISSQIWYPSEDFNAPTGLLTAAYNRGDAGFEYAQFNWQQRIDAAVAGGETLHEGYGDKVYAQQGLTIAWQYMPGQIAGWAAETYEAQCDIYKTVTTLPQGNIFLAGDTYSQTPGWQEGALDSARLAVRAIIEGKSSTDPTLYGSGSVMSCPVE